MSVLAVLGLAVALAADCFAVALALGAGMRPGLAQKASTAVRVGLVFGVMQMAMPVVGYAIGAFARAHVALLAHWLGAALLFVVAAHMAYEAVEDWRGGEAAGGEKEPQTFADGPGWWRLLALGLATSIDALGAGFSLGTWKVALVQALATIGLASLFAGMLGVLLGGRLRRLLGPMAELGGAIVLAAIALRALTG